MNLIISESRKTDIELEEAGHQFLGAADSRIGELHIFLNKDAKLATQVAPEPANVEYLKIRITYSIAGMPFPYGHLSTENAQFIRDFVGEEFQAIRANMNYYQLKNGMLVHIYNAFELPRKS